MGDERINKVVTALRARGLRTERGYPDSWMPQLSSPVAAVNLQRENPDTYVIGVDIYGPLEQGGAACEEAAQKAKAALLELGAIPHVGECRYSAKKGLFNLNVSGTWVKTLPYTVRIHQQNAVYATSFSAKQIIDLEPLDILSEGVTRVVRKSRCWKVTVEEMLPLNHPVSGELAGEFDITVFYPGTTVTYHGCRWEYTFREDTRKGVRQVRVARTWKERVIADG